MDRVSADQVWIVIPAFNEASAIGQVIHDVQKVGYQKILVVDDGSADATSQVAAAAGAIALRHKLNRGKGAAAKTGIEAARLLNAQIIVTMDGDGQHDPSDISRLLRPLLEEGYDVALGVRSYRSDAMPWYKVMHNQMANGITWTYSGLWVQDSQSGFRAFSKQALSLIQTQSDAYEYESEVIKEIGRHNLRYAEVPIAVRYTTYSMSKTHKQGVVNGIKTMYKMVWNRLL